MFIYNKILKLWDEKGLTIMFTFIIIFFIVYWFLFTSENKDGTYNKISLKNLFINITGTNPASIINKAGSEACSINSSCAN